MSDYNAKEEKIQEMIESLIRNGVDARLIISRFESKIFDLKKPELYFWFARYIAGADVKAHEQIVINSGDPEYNYKFARDIIGEDVKAHEQVVFKYGNQIESELESLDNYLDDTIASSEKDASKSMAK